MPLHWRLYYDDGSTFSDADGPPEAAPPLGVQAVVQLDADLGRHVLSGADFYYWEPTYGMWERTESFGLWDYLCRPGAFKVVRFGRNMTNQAFRAVYARAVGDPDFPRKSGRRADERAPD